MHQEKGITPTLVFAIFSAVLGMFQFGFNTGVINAPQKVLEEFIANIYKNRTGFWITEELRDIIWSLTVSIFAVGGMLGGLVAPIMANWCGRKTGLVLNNTIAILGVTLMSSAQLSQSIECLIVGRFFIGLNCGLSTALVPMYLTEIATVNIRGALGTISQLGATIGLLLSQILGLKEILGNKEYWPFLFGFAFIPAVLQLLMLPFCPESPRYLLLSCGRVSEARLALKRLRKSTNDIEYDMEEMRAEERAQEEEVRLYGKLSSISELIHHPWLRTPLIIGVMMQLSQQLSGINAIFYYSTDIFLSAEVPDDYAVYATIGVGLVMVLMTLISVPLMDKLGRRTLHLFGLGGMFLASIFLTISLLVKFLYDWMKYISVISILLYALFFGIGPGSLPWMITAELFTQGTRPAAMSVSVLVNWFTNFVVGLTFPFMKRGLQSYLFLPFTVFLAIFWIFTYKKLPETKNRTFEEIAALFRPLHLTAASANQFQPHMQHATDCTGFNSNYIPTAHGSLVNTPNNADGNNSANSINHQQHLTRFRFDSNAMNTNNAANFLANNQATCSTNINSCNCNHNQINDMASQQQLQQQIPHTSCTSIAQNLSTNDQQPLIVADVIDESRCSYHHHQQPPIQATPGQCCLRTTSFMANNGHGACECCLEQPTATGANFGISSKQYTGLGSIYSRAQNGILDNMANGDQLRSRTLTRVYKPLNDVATVGMATSTNDLQVIQNQNSYLR